MGQEDITEFGADFVDNPLPIGHLTLDWPPPFEMLEQANVRWAAPWQGPDQKRPHSLPAS